MKSFFYRDEPRLGDWIGLGLFLAGYLALMGLVLMPKTVQGAAQAALGQIIGQ